MDFLQSYPVAFRKHALAAIRKAEIEFTRNCSKSNADPEEEYRNYLKCAVYAFVDAHCVAGEQGEDLSTVELDTKWLFEDLCRDTYPRMHPDPGREDDYESFQRRLWEDIQRSDDWLARLKRMVAIADGGSAQKKSAGRQRSPVIKERREIVGKHAKKASDLNDVAVQKRLFKELDSKEIPLPLRDGTRLRTQKYGDLKGELRHKIIVTLKQDLQRHKDRMA
jgi:hypothetical protein